ncbi:Dirigent protein 19 [Linum grandiflorum]
MAKLHQIIASIFIISALLSTIVQADHDDYVKTLNPKRLNKMLRSQKKLTHFHFFWHDIYSGATPSAMQVVASPSNTSQTGFGFVSMIDNPMTVGPQLDASNSSNLMGRAQGFYGSADQSELAVMVAMNLVFLQGKYNGSTVTLMGRNRIAAEVRETAVVGGTGVFRFASGFATASTFRFNQTSGDAVAEYDLYVLHY